MAAPRYRPPEPIFRALCRHYTRAEIAEICNVTPDAVSLWSSHYDCRPVRSKPGPKPQQHTLEPPPNKRFQDALLRGLKTCHAD